MTEYISVGHFPGKDAITVGVPGQTGRLYNWLRILAGGVSEFSEIRMRGPIRDENGLLIVPGGGGAVAPFTAAVNPTVNDDLTAGFATGEAWLNTVTGQYWLCYSAAAGAAIWMRDSVMYGSNIFSRNDMTSITTTTDSVVLGEATVPAVSNIVAIGTVTVNPGANRAVALGSSSLGPSIALANDCVTIGGATVDDAGVGIGRCNAGSRSVAIGETSTALNDDVAIGQAAVTGGVICVAIGVGSNAAAADSVAVGASAIVDASAPRGIAIGNTVTIGPIAADDSIGIGRNVLISSQDCVGIGANIQITGNDSVLIGTGNSSAAHCICIGDDSDATQANALCIGANADSAPGNPLFTLAFGGVDPVTVTSQMAYLPTKTVVTDRNIVMRDTDLALDDLGDVVQTAAANTQYLYHNATNWVNSATPRYTPWVWPNEASSINVIIVNSYTHWQIFAHFGETFTATTITLQSTLAGVNTNVALYSGPNSNSGRNRLAQATAAQASVVGTMTYTLNTPVTITSGTVYNFALSNQTANIPIPDKTAFTNIGYGSFNNTYYGTGAFPLVSPAVTAGGRRFYFELY